MFIYLYTFLFYFLRLSCSYSSHSLHHPSLELSTNSLTLRYRAQPFLSGRCPFIRALHIGRLTLLYPASSHFGTQQQLTHPPVKSSTLPLSKMTVFQGAAPRHTIFTSSCVIPLWDSATAHSPSGKELNPSSQEDTRFSGRCTLTYRFSLHPASSLFGTQQQLPHPPVKRSSFHLWKNHLSQGLLLC